MRVLHLSYDYGLKGTSGAPIAAARLHQALLRAGVDSHFLCVRALEYGPNLTVLPRSWIGQKLYYFFPRVIWVLSKLLLGKMYMPNLIPLPGFVKAVKKLNPDIVHIHLIALDMVSFEQLQRLNCRFVYTLHDLAGINAVDSHPCDDRRFAEGFTQGNSNRIERWMFNRKYRFIKKTNPVFTGPSNWACGMFHESLIGRGRHATTILNIVDPVFKYDPAKVVPHDKFTILFGSFGGRAATLKGWKDLEMALNLLPENIRQSTTVHIFGEDAADYDLAGIRVHFLGLIKDTAKLASIYHSADAFAFPSRRETQGMVKIEALSTGLPVIAFNRSACAESIYHKENGWVAPDGDIADYANGIAFFYEKFKHGELSAMRKPIAENANKDFSEPTIVDQMLDVYQKAIGE